MSGCRITSQDTSHLTFHARGMDRVLWSCKSKPPLILQKESKQKIFDQSKFECLGVSSSLKIHHIWQCAHMKLIRCHSLANQTLRWTSMKNRYKNFPSEQVRMSGCRVLFGHTMDLTLHARGLDRVLWSCKSNLPLDLNLFSKTNFLNKTKFKCLGVSSSLKIHHI